MLTWLSRAISAQDVIARYVPASIDEDAVDEFTYLRDNIEGGRDLLASVKASLTTTTPINASARQDIEAAVVVMTCLPILNNVANGKHDVYSAVRSMLNASYPSLSYENVPRRKVPSRGDEAFTLSSGTHSAANKRGTVSDASRDFGGERGRTRGDPRNGASNSGTSAAAASAPATSTSTRQTHPMMGRSGGRAPIPFQALPVPSMMSSLEMREDAGKRAGMASTVASIESVLRTSGLDSSSVQRILNEVHRANAGDRPSDLRSVLGTIGGVVVDGKAGAVPSQDNNLRDILIDAVGNSGSPNAGKMAGVLRVVGDIVDRYGDKAAAFVARTAVASKDLVEELDAAETGSSITESFRDLGSPALVSTFALVARKKMERVLTFLAKSSKSPRFANVLFSALLDPTVSASVDSFMSRAVSGDLETGIAMDLRESSDIGFLETNDVRELELASTSSASRLLELHNFGTVRDAIFSYSDLERFVEVHPNVPAQYRRVVLEAILAYSAYLDTTSRDELSSEILGKSRAFTSVGFVSSLLGFLLTRKGSAGHASLGVVTFSAGYKALLLGQLARFIDARESIIAVARELLGLNEVSIETILDPSSLPELAADIVVLRPREMGAGDGLAGTHATAQVEPRAVPPATEQFMHNVVNATAGTEPIPASTMAATNVSSVNALSSDRDSSQASNQPTTALSLHMNIAPTFITSLWNFVTGGKSTQELERDVIQLPPPPWWDMNKHLPAYAHVRSSIVDTSPHDARFLGPSPVHEAMIRAALDPTGSGLPESVNRTLARLSLNLDVFNFDIHSDSKGTALNLLSLGNGDLITGRDIVDRVGGLAHSAPALSSQSGTVLVPPHVSRVSFGQDLPLSALEIPEARAFSKLMGPTVDYFEPNAPVNTHRCVPFIPIGSFINGAFPILAQPVNPESMPPLQARARAFSDISGVGLRESFQTRTIAIPSRILLCSELDALVRDVYSSVGFASAISSVDHDSGSREAIDAIQASCYESPYEMAIHEICFEDNQQLIMRRDSVGISTLRGYLTQPSWFSSCLSMRGVDGSLVRLTSALSLRERELVFVRFILSIIARSARDTIVEALSSDETVVVANVLDHAAASKLANTRMRALLERVAVSAIQRSPAGTFRYDASSDHVGFSRSSYSADIDLLGLNFFSNQEATGVDSLIPRVAGAIKAEASRVAMRPSDLPASDLIALRDVNVPSQAPTISQAMRPDIEQDVKREEFEEITGEGVGDLTEIGDDEAMDEVAVETGDVAVDPSGTSVSTENEPLAKAGLVANLNDMASDAELREPESQNALVAQMEIGASALQRLNALAKYGGGSIVRLRVGQREGFIDLLSISSSFAHNVGGRDTRATTATPADATQDDWANERLEIAGGRKVGIGSRRRRELREYRAASRPRGALIGLGQDVMSNSLGYSPHWWRGDLARVPMKAIARKGLSRARVSVAKDVCQFVDALDATLTSVLNGFTLGFDKTRWNGVMTCLFPGMPLTSFVLGLCSFVPLSLSQFSLPLSSRVSTNVRRQVIDKVLHGDVKRGKVFTSGPLFTVPITELDALVKRTLSSGHQAVATCLVAVMIDHAANPRSAWGDTKGCFIMASGLQSLDKEACKKARDQDCLVLTRLVMKEPIDSTLFLSIRDNLEQSMTKGLDLRTARRETLVDDDEDDDEDHEGPMGDESSRHVAVPRAVVNQTLYPLLMPKVRASPDNEIALKLNMSSEAVRHLRRNVFPSLEWIDSGKRPTRAIVSLLERGGLLGLTPSARDELAKLAQEKTSTLSSIIERARELSSETERVPLGEAMSSIESFSLPSTRSTDKLGSSLPRVNLMEAVDYGEAIMKGRRTMAGESKFAQFEELGKFLASHLFNAQSAPASHEKGRNVAPIVQRAPREDVRQQQQQQSTPVQDGTLTRFWLPILTDLRRVTAARVASEVSSVDFLIGTRVFDFEVVKYMGQVSDIKITLDSHVASVMDRGGLEDTLQQVEMLGPDYVQGAVDMTSLIVLRFLVMSCSALFAVDSDTVDSPQLDHDLVAELDIPFRRGWVIMQHAVAKTHVIRLATPQAIAHACKASGLYPAKLARSTQVAVSADNPFAHLPMEVDKRELLTGMVAITRYHIDVLHATLGDEIENTSGANETSVAVETFLRSLLDSDDKGQPFVSAWGARLVEGAVRSRDRGAVSRIIHTDQQQQSQQQQQRPPAGQREPLENNQPRNELGSNFRAVIGHGSRVR